MTDKFIYEGFFNYGKIEGNGRVDSTLNLFSFEGIFNGKSQPIKGNLIINNQENDMESYTVYLNNYPENKARIVFNEGRQYEGDINYDKFVPSGLGTAKYANGSFYEGEWEDGKFHGKGKFNWTDGSSYEGEYEHGKKEGQGSFVYPSKKVYRGRWHNGKQEGEGTLLDSDENSLKSGTWSQGKYLVPAQE